MWFLSPSGWPTVATDGSLFAQSLFDRGWVVMDAAEVQVAIDAYNAGEVFVPTPPDYVDEDELADAIAGAIVTVPDATSTVRGKVRLGGDLAGTADVPTVPGLAGKVDTATFTAAMGNKVDLTSLTAALATKANVTDLVGKANVADLPEQLVLNVLDFGAVGDGVTNDQPAMQAALDAADAAGGGTVLIPTGTYNVVQALRAGANTVILAYGATIRSMGAGLLYNFLDTDSFPAYTGKGDITVLGGVWDANASDGASGTVTAGFNGLFFSHASGITVRDVTVLNISSGHHIELNAISGALVENCRLLGYRDNSGDGSRPFSEAIQIDAASSSGAGLLPFDDTTCRDITVRGCTAGPSSRLPAPGRLIGNHGHTAPTAHSGITVTGNRSTGSAREGINALCWRRAVIADNIIDSPGAAGIAVTTVAGLALDSVIVRDNIITGSAGSGISVLGLSGATISEALVSGNVTRDATGSAITVAYAPGGKVVDNHAWSPTAGGIGITFSDAALIKGNTLRDLAVIGVFVGGCAGILVASNVVDGCASHAVNLATQSGTPTTDGVVTGNMLRNISGAGVRLSAGVLRTTVTNNQVRKGTGTATNGLSLDATATGSILAGNDLSGNGWTAANAVAVSTSGAKTDYAGGTAVPGHNLI